MPESGKPKGRGTSTSRWQRPLAWFADGKLLLGIAAGAVVTAGSLVDSADKVRIFFGGKPGALLLAENASRAEFSRELTTLTWKRLFWMRNVVQDAVMDAGKEQSDQTWKKYVEVLEEWNAKLMINIVTLEKFYGPERAHEFEVDIQRIFLSTHRCLMKLRTGVARAGDSECDQAATDKEKEIESVRGHINDLNRKLYYFIRQTQPKS